MVTTILSVKYKSEEVLRLELRPCDATKKYPYVKEVFVTKKPKDKIQLQFIRDFIAFTTNQYGNILCGDHKPFDKGNLGYSTQEDWEAALSRLPESFVLEVINRDPAKEPPLPPGAIP